MKRKKIERCPFYFIYSHYYLTNNLHTRNSYSNTNKQCELLSSASLLFCNTILNTLNNTFFPFALTNFPETPTKDLIMNPSLSPNSLPSAHQLQPPNFALSSFKSKHTFKQVQPPISSNSVSSAHISHLILLCTHSYLTHFLNKCNIKVTLLSYQYGKLSVIHIALFLASTYLKSMGALLEKCNQKF